MGVGFFDKEQLLSRDRLVWVAVIDETREKIGPALAVIDAQADPGNNSIRAFHTLYKNCIRRGGLFVVVACRFPLLRFPVWNKQGLQRKRPVRSVRGCRT